VLGLCLFLIKKMPLNALKLIYCKFHIAQIVDIENIENIIKGALEVFLSVYKFFLYNSMYNCDPWGRVKLTPGV